MLGLVKVVGEQQVGVLVRFGKPREPPRGPGRVWTIPRVDQLVIVNLRPTTIDLPPVVATTKDGRALSTVAHVHARVVSPRDAALRVVDYVQATSQLAETAVRSVLEEYSADDALFDRATIERVLQQTINEATERWGVEVSRVEIDFP
jgi:regulator of protease activity HflC (stomatin/prohibitin superfamily)